MAAAHSEERVPLQLRLPEPLQSNLWQQQGIQYPVSLSLRKSEQNLQLLHQISRGRRVVGGLRPTTKQTGSVPSLQLLTSVDASHLFLVNEYIHAMLTLKCLSFVVCLCVCLSILGPPDIHYNCYQEKKAGS